MSHEIRIEAIAPWIEVLCEAGDDRARDRLLLEAVLALDLASAAAIWRRRGRGAWSEHVARGPAELLPRATEVEAVAGRRLSTDVLPARRVYVSGDVALALGGVTPERDELDTAEALLATYVVISAGVLRDGSSDGETHAWPAPLPAIGARARNAKNEMGVNDPAAEEARRMQHDLRNVMTSLRATEDLLSRFAEGLSPEESVRFHSAVERECARAGEIIAQGLTGATHAADDAESARISPHPSGADSSSPGRTSAGMESAPSVLPTARGSCCAARVLDEVLDAERAAFQAARIDIERLIDPASRTQMCALSADRFARLVQNLFVNARQALASSTARSEAADAQTADTQPRHRIWVTLEPATLADVAALALIVEDDGPGFIAPDRVAPARADPRAPDSAGAASALERVFEAGFTTKPNSTGRGLAIVRELSAEAGGVVRAEVRALGGARVRAILPIAGDDARLPQTDP